MADHAKPVLTSTYTNFVTELDARFDDLAVGLDPAVTTATNLPTNSIRWNSASSKYQKYNGTSWVDLSSSYRININGTVGATTPDTGAFTTLSATGVATLTANPVLSAGVVNGVPYLNGSKVLTSGSALTFDGSALNVTAANGVQVVGGGLSSYFYADAVGGNISVPGNNALRAYVNGSEKMRLTSTGLGIGTSSPSGKLDVAGFSGTVRVETSGDALTFTKNGANYISAKGGSSGTLVFETGGANERMRLDSSGNLLVGTTTQPWGLFKQAVYSTNLATAVNGIAVVNGANSTGGYYMGFVNYLAGLAGFISQTGASTVNYATSSDYRLKEDVQPMTGALAKVSALKPCTYKWKVDGSNGQGFIAHELAEVVPDAVTGEKDAVNEDGSIKTQGIDTSFLVATLTAAIQEQQAIIDQLKARLDAANI